MTEENIYKEYVESFFIRIGFLNGSLFHLRENINGFEKLYSKSKKETEVDKFMLGARLAISDVSGPTDNGALYFYVTKGKYTVTESNFKEYNEGIINEFASFVILQSYESFKLFLKSVISLYYSRYPELIKGHGVIRPKKRNHFLVFLNSLFTRNKEKYEMKDIMQKLNPGKFDSLLFRYLRKLSKHYKKYERNNNRRIDFQEFHKVYALCRHSITHNNSFIKNSETKHFTPYQKKVLNYFAPVETENGKRIKLNQKDTAEILVRICEHAFLIFKSLSIQEGLDWKILKNMK